MIAATELVAEVYVASLLDHGEPVGEILTRGERTASSGDAHGAYRGVRRAVGERCVQRFGERLVECVQYIGSVEREDRDRPLSLDP